MLNDSFPNELCELTLQKIRAVLDEPALLAFEKAETICALLEPLMQDESEDAPPRGRSLEDMEREIFV